MNVYDLKNAGPRHRFLVRGKTGTPLLVSNCTQAIAFDLMAYGGMNAESQGYSVTNLIHDQALADYQTGQQVSGFTKALTNLPPWAHGLPLKAEGKVTPYYTK